MAQTPRNARYQDDYQAATVYTGGRPQRSRIGVLGTLVSYLVAAPLTMIGVVSTVVLVLLVIAPYFPEGEDPLTQSAGTLGGALAAAEEPGKELDLTYATRQRDMENHYAEREMKLAGEIDQRGQLVKGAIDQMTLELNANIRAVDEQLLTSHITNFGAEVACLYALSDPALGGTCGLAEAQRERNLVWRTQMLDRVPRLAHSREDILEMIEVSEEDLIRTEMSYQVGE